MLSGNVKLEFRLRSVFLASRNRLNAMDEMISGVVCAVWRVICIVSLLAAYPAFARQPQNANPNTASISGRITVANGEGVTNVLAGVTVKLTSASSEIAPQSAVTDTDGRYQFTHLAAGNYTLGTKEDGFQPSSAVIVLSAGQAVVEDVILKIISVDQKVEVQGQAAEIATQSSGVTGTVSDQQLDTLPLPTQKFTEALTLVPGVIRTREGQLSFKGQSESQGMLVVDSTENVDPVSGSFAIPIPLEAIQSITVYNLPESSEYGGFSGGLTTIETKPPSTTWNYKLLDFITSFRGKNGHLAGLGNWTPRFEFGGPLVKNKFNFSQEVTYEIRKLAVRGLPWPNNETKTRSITSFTQLQVILSPRHLLNINVNVFPLSIEFANINTLVPQSASANYGRNGASISLSDSYQFSSGALLNTIVRYTRFDSDVHGQGLANMEITPEGWGGDFFNTWSRKANQVEALPTYQLSSKSWHGNHEIRFGADVLYRSYGGSSVSHPIDLLAQDGSLAERIDFQGPGVLRASDSEIAEFIQDHWSLSSHLTLNFGARLSSQTIGRDAAFAPRAGAAYSLNGGRTVLRASAAEIYGHVPLLAADFTDNQTRVLSFFNPSGTLLGQPIVLQNTYLLSGVASPGSAVPIDPGSSPRTFTWNVEVQHEVRKNLLVRAGYLESYTADLFVVDPLVDAAAGTGFLALRDNGVSHYHQAEVTARYKPGQRVDLTMSYTWSRARGDLNTLSDTYTPFQTPVIRPNVSGIRPTDVPYRVVASGLVRLPWKLFLSPVADVHSGLPFSTIDVFQNYVGEPNSSRFPTYFSLDARIYREISLHLPFTERSKTTKFRLGVYSTDVTNRQNPHDVYNNVASPIFGQFAGFQRRFDGLVLDLVP
jgi:hypothetical protein